MARDAVAEVRERTEIVELISQYVQLKKTGRSYKGLCPFHQEKTPSFIVFPDSGNFHCFGCGKGGDAFTFYMGVEHVEFREALQELARRAGVELGTTPTVAPEVDAHRNRLIEINELVAEYYRNVLRNTGAGAPGREVLEKRGIDAAVAERFGLGFAPEGDALYRYLQQRNIETEMAIIAGVLHRREDGRVRDRFWNRLLFPIRTREGRTVGFGGRALGDLQPKYLNSAQSSIFDKSTLLFGLDLAEDAIRKEDQVVVVEGYMDALTAHQFGSTNVVACMGTAITEQQVGLVKRLSRNIVLALDADAAGQGATIRSLEMLPGALDRELIPIGVERASRPGADTMILWQRRFKTHISIVQLPEGKDPDELIRRDPDSWPKVVASALPFLDDVLWNRALGENDRSSPERKAAFERDLKALVGGIKDEMVRRHYLDDLRLRLQTLWGQGRPQVGGGARMGPGRSFQPRLKPGQRPWEVPQAASPQLRAAASANTAAAAAERRERMIILSAINHPELLHDFWEDFAGLDFTARALASLRTLILDVASSEEVLDRAALKTHLSSKGFGPDLDRLEDQAKRLNEWFLGPAAAPDDARTGLRQMIALHRKTVTLDRELKAAEAAFARDPSEDTQAALFAVRDQLSSALGSEALIEGFGAASGRGGGEAM